MVNGSRYYRALESVSLASALSTALTIYPCQIRVHQRWQSKLQLPTARKEWWPATADSSPQAVTCQCQHCDTHYFSRPRTTTFRLLVRRATSSATDAPKWGHFQHSQTDCISRNVGVFADSDIYDCVVCSMNMLKFRRQTTETISSMLLCHLHFSICILHKYR